MRSGATRTTACKPKNGSFGCVKHCFLIFTLLLCSCRTASDIRLPNPSKDFKIELESKYSDNLRIGQYPSQVKRILGKPLLDFTHKVEQETDHEGVKITNTIRVLSYYYQYGDFPIFLDVVFVEANNRWLLSTWNHRIILPLDEDFLSGKDKDNTPD